MWEPSGKRPAGLTKVKRALICAAVLRGMWHPAFVMGKLCWAILSAASSASRKTLVRWRLLVMIRLPFSTDVPFKKSDGIHLGEFAGQSSTNELAKRSLRIVSRQAFSHP